MAKLAPKTLMWGASTDLDVVSYQLFWCVPPAVIDYTSPNVNIGKVTSVALPVTGMPLIDGNLTIGIAAVDDVGNMSDISSATFPFDLKAPVAPGIPYLAP